MSFPEGYRHPIPPPPPPGETDEERVERFRPMNDSIWGVGGWEACTRCPADGDGKPVFHSTKAHT